MGSASLAIRRVVGLIARNPNLARAANLRHQPVGNFDTATMTVANSKLIESVRVMADKISVGEMLGGDVEAGDRKYILPAHGLIDPPAVEDVLELGADSNGKPIAWQIVQVDTIEMGDTPIAYVLIVRR